MKLIDSPAVINEDFPDYLRDESRMTAPRIDALAWPENEADIIEALALARGNSWPVTISAGRTGICGAAVPMCGGMLLSVEKLNGITGIARGAIGGEWILTLQAGVTLQTINDCLQHNDFDAFTSAWSQESLDALEQIREQALRLFYPPVLTELTAEIGGTAATNASGARTFKYKATRDWTRRIRVILADGSVLDLKRGDVHADESGRLSLPVRAPDGSARTVEIALPRVAMPATKHVAGYYATPGMDAIDLFIGSEGTLGVITELDIALIPRTKETYAITVFFDDEKPAVDFTDALRNAARGGVLDIESIEFTGRRALDLLHRRHEQGDPKIPDFPATAGAAILFEVAFNPETMEEEYGLVERYLACSGVSTDQVWAGTTDEEIRQMKEFRHAVPETINQIIGERKRSMPALHKIATDLAVPDDKLHEMMDYYKATLEAAGIEYYVFGHIGNSHLHVNMVPRNEGELEKSKELYRAFAAKSVSLGGTVSGEHGVGKLKRDFLGIMFGEDGIAQMKAVKRALDPEGMLGKGTLFG
ncbi:FAD-binding oxidoreductase [bacterium]|nr:FAD-binding oxidoreductase [bacterium]